MTDDSIAGRVLVVDDELNIRDLLEAGLGLHGFEVRAAGTGREALASAAEWDPDLVVLDVGLPDLHGLDVARSLRAARDVPVLFLTARDSVDDRIAGFSAGGDDYVTKPFSLEEVVLRVRAILRRSVAGAAADEEIMRYADLELDLGARLVRRGGRTIELTPTEFRLLHYLLINVGHVVGKSQILERVWDTSVTDDSRVVDTYVSYLRRKIDAEGIPLIHTLRGVGYTLRKPLR